MLILMMFENWLNRFCGTDNDWLKAVKYRDCVSLHPNYYADAREYLKDNFKFSDKLIDLLINNSKEENWPEGLKTPELRKKNENTIKQLKFGKF